MGECVFSVWSSARWLSFPCRSCNTGCPYTNLCLFDLCSSHGLHYFITYFDMIICYFFFPSCWLCCRQCYNFGKGKTTNERYSKQKKRTPSVAADTDDATSLITGNEE